VGCPNSRPVPGRSLTRPRRAASSHRGFEPRLDRAKTCPSLTRRANDQKASDEGCCRNNGQVCIHDSVYRAFTQR